VNPPSTSYTSGDIVRRCIECGKWHRESPLILSPSNNTFGGRDNVPLALIRGLCKSCACVVCIDIVRELELVPCKASYAGDWLAAFD